jgi:glucoamylase
MLYGRVLRIQTDANVLVHWSTDNWRTREDTASRAVPGLGIRLSDLETSALPPRAEVVFTMYYPDEQRWEGRDYRVVIEA